MPPVQSTLYNVLGGQASSASVNVFTTADCTSPFQLSSNSNLLLVDKCYNLLQRDIKAFSVPSRQTCTDDQELMLLISKQPDCSTPDSLIPLTSLTPDQCHAFTSSMEKSDTQSIKVICRPGKGKEEVEVEASAGVDLEKDKAEEEEKETNILPSPPPPRIRGKRGNNVSVGVNANCCRACVVM